MRVILLGPPGVGKGTQADEISKKYNIPHISSGDIFRENVKLGTDLGKQAKAYLDNGKLVPDDLTIKLICTRLKEDDCTDGFLLDGFPRTVFQAKTLDKFLKDEKINIDVVISLDANKDVIAKRTSGRRVCKVCRTTYNIESKPTKVPGICDLCGGEVYQRADDNEETVARRIEVYLKETKPLVDYYTDFGCLVHIDGNQEMKTVTQTIMKALKGL